MLNAVDLKYALDVVATLAATGAHTATKYVSPRMVIRATRPMFGAKGKKKVPKGGNFQCTLVLGKPNYRQREYIKMLKKAGEPFPVNKVIIKFPPKAKS